MRFPLALCRRLHSENWQFTGAATHHTVRSNRTTKKTHSDLVNKWSGFLGTAVQFCQSQIGEQPLLLALDLLPDAEQHLDGRSSRDLRMGQGGLLDCGAVLD